MMKKQEKSQLLKDAYASYVQIQVVEVNIEMNNNPTKAFKTTEVY